MAMENIVWGMITPFQQQQLYRLYLNNQHWIPYQTAESLKHHKLLTNTLNAPRVKMNDDSNHLVEWAIAQHLIGEPFYLGLYEAISHNSPRSYQERCKGLIVTTNPEYRRDALAKGYVTISKQTYESQYKYMQTGGKLAATI